MNHLAIVFLMICLVLISYGLGRRDGWVAHRDRYKHIDLKDDE